MNEKTFSGKPARLISPERIASLQPEAVISAVLSHGTFSSVLDIGCGSGLFAKYFAERGLQVSGIDLRTEMVDAARQYVPAGTFKEASFDMLPFDDNSFDLAFMGFVLHESDDFAVTLAEAARVTTGCIAVVEWPYKEETAGPPLRHRLTAEQIATAAGTNGCTPLPAVALNGKILYLLDIN